MRSSDYALSRTECDCLINDTSATSVVLESASTEHHPVDEETQSSCAADIQEPSEASSTLTRSVVAARSPPSAVVTRRSSSDHPQTGRDQVDTAERRKVGVAARFVATGAASTSNAPCQPESKTSDTASGQQSRRNHTGSRTSTTEREQSPASSSSSSSSSDGAESVPDGYSRVARCVEPVHTSERDVQRLVDNCRQLNDSQFYVAELSSTDAKRRLRFCAAGTFLVRDSAHPRHLYSLTVKTQRGVTSIRTVYTADGFRLDSDPEQVSSEEVYSHKSSTCRRSMKR